MRLPYDWGSGASHSATVTTDTPYYVVEWYLDDVYKGCTPGGYEGDEDGPTTATFNFSGISGELQGDKHRIKAIAWDQEDHDDSASDTKFYEIRVFAPLTVDTGFKRTGVMGHVELTRHYFDGEYINVEGYVYAFNYSGNEARAKSWFRQTEYESDASNALGTGWERQDPPFDVPNPLTKFGHGESYNDSGSSYISFYVGRNMGPDDVYYLNPHIHLEVSNNVAVDVWHESGTMINTFNNSHNPPENPPE